MADLPWGEILVGTGAVLTGIGAGFGVMFRALQRSQARERAALKLGWKQAIRGQRYARVELEQTERGSASVAPPPLPDEEIEDDTGIHDAMLREDERFFSERRLRIQPGLPSMPPLEAFIDPRSLEERRRAEVDRQLRKFTSDGESTPPEPVVRRRLPSRPR